LSLALLIFVRYIQRRTSSVTEKESGHILFRY